MSGYTVSLIEILQFVLIKIIFDFSTYKIYSLRNKLTQVCGIINLEINFGFDSVLSTHCSSMTGAACYDHYCRFLLDFDLYLF